jgi:transposase InsO family protein
MRYRVIQEHDRRYPIRLMCRALAVSPAGYYAWRGRPESRRAAANHTLLATIRVLHQESRQTYGSPSIWRALRKQGHRVGEHRVARLMRHDGLRAKTVKKWRATTQSNHHLPVAANTLQRQFTVSQPNRVWAGDITYVWTLEGWLYLAVLLDLYSRSVIGWAMGPRLTGDLTEQALQWRSPLASPLRGSCITPIAGVRADSSGRCNIFFVGLLEQVVKDLYRRFQFSVLRGLALRAAATAAISSALCTLRSVPFGKYWRSNPLVFSLVPRCHGL